MVDVRIATSAEQPVNTDGAVSTVAAGEGATVGLDGNGELAQADAASGSAVPAVGVLATPVDDPSNYPGDQFEYAAKVAESQRNLVNEDRAGYVRYGVELVNEDADWGFTPGEPVYLAEGGGFTQTEPSNTGDLVQVLGYAVEAEVVMLEIDADYTTV
jgi:hypothetical protein